MDRRNFIAGAALLPAACAAPALAGPASLDEAGLAECLSRFRAAREVATRFDEDIHQPLAARWQAAKAAVPHYTTKTGYESKGAGYRHLTTSRSVDVAVARAYAKRPYATGSDLEKCVKELAEAQQAREQQLADLDREYRHVEETYDRSNELLGIACDILGEMETYPVETMAGLLRKLELVKECDGEITVEIITADVRRIASAGRA